MKTKTNCKEVYVPLLMYRQAKLLMRIQATSQPWPSSLKYYSSSATSYNHMTRSPCRLPLLTPSELVLMRQCFELYGSVSATGSATVLDFKREGCTSPPTTRNQGQKWTGVRTSQCIRVPEVSLLVLILQLSGQLLLNIMHANYWVLEGNHAVANIKMAATTSTASLPIAQLWWYIPWSQVQILE